MMSDAAATSSTPPMTITDGEFQDDSLPADPVLQFGTYIDTESNVSIETPSLNKGALPDDRNVPDLNLAPTETTLVTEMVTLVHQAKRSAEPSEAPQSKKKKKSGLKKKEVTSFYFDSGNPPESVSWVQMDSCEDTWAPFVDGSMVPETQKQEWDAVFSSVSKLKGRNTQTGK